MKKRRIGLFCCGGCMLRTIVSFLFALCIVSTEATAQSIVQNSSNQAIPAQGGLQGFDYSLGTLESVTLQIQATENRWGYGHIGLWPTGAPDVVDVTWLVDSTAGFQTWLVGGQRVEFLVPVFGTGTTQVNASARFIDMVTTGSATFSIDPSLIPQLGSFTPWYDFAISYFGPGFYDGSDVQWSSSYPLNPGTLWCSGGEESCNSLRYTLTYNYTPASSAVPEPATWAMMLFGFGSIGFMLRRRRATKYTVFA